MTNPFRDQAKFMTACGQSVSEINNAQYAMYLDLIDEEREELKEAIVASDNSFF